MSNIAKLFSVMLVIASLVFIPMGSSFAAVMEQEDEASAESMMADLLVARPLGLVSMMVGTVFYVVSYPFSAAGENEDKAYQKLVHDPAEFTFHRPLGDF